MKHSKIILAGDKLNYVGKANNTGAGSRMTDWQGRWGLEPALGAQPTWNQALPQDALRAETRRSYEPRYPTHNTWPWFVCMMHDFVF